MNFYRVSNLDIKMIYIANEDRHSDEWKYTLFNKVKFFADTRVKKYKKNIKKEDVRQEAFIGLWIAIKTFDYHKNFDFYRWAQWHISKNLRDFAQKEKSFLAAKSNTYNDNVADYNDDKVEQKIIISEVLYENKFCLSDQETKILFENLLLGKTLSDIGHSMSLSAERIRQIRNSSLKKIKLF